MGAMAAHVPTVLQVANYSSSTGYGIAPVTMADDGSYYVVFQAGEISFRAAIDTGSADSFVTTSNVTLIEEISGLLGLGFPRLSEIYATAANATPFFATLASQGILGYPLFGLSLTRNSSGTITLARDNNTFVLQPSDYIIGPAASNPNLCLSWPRALPPSADGIDWQLGTPFLRTVYSVWSYGIDYKEPPVIGLYAKSNATATVESPAEVASFLSSASATVATELPNYVLATPSYTTPPYTFNTSVPATLGEVVASELATSTYEPLLVTPSTNVSAIPKVSDAYTLIYTSQGVTVTTTYHVSDPTAALGVPPGMSGAPSLRTAFVGLGTAFVVTAATTTWILS
ncbi:hypothetical protein ID866_5815 [Astraeus odoratus]|nr:hypothetical protein ID866_5815 [Astraeus odoratus]